MNELLCAGPCGQPLTEEGGVLEVRRYRVVTEPLLDSIEILRVPMVEVESCNRFRRARLHCRDCAMKAVDRFVYQRPISDAEGRSAFDSTTCE